METQFLKHLLLQADYLVQQRSTLAGPGDPKQLDLGELVNAVEPVVRPNLYAPLALYVLHPNYLATETVAKRNHPDRQHLWGQDLVHVHASERDLCRPHEAQLVGLVLLALNVVHL